MTSNLGEGKAGSSIFKSVAASLAVAMVVNFVAFTFSFGRLSISVEQLDKRLSMLEKKYDKQQEDYQDINVSMAKIESVMNMVSKNIQDLQVDNRALLLSINGDSEDDGHQNRRSR